MNPLTPIDYAVAWLIMRIHAGLSVVFGSSSGWSWAGAIVILVVLMRLILVPLFIKQMHSTRKMAALAPQLQELKKKYKGDKAKLNEETMRLYKEHGANPLAGCLPLVLQFPLFFALFDVLRAIAEWVPGQKPAYGLTTSVVQSAQHASIFGASVSDRFLVKLFPPTLMHIGLASQIVIFALVITSATTTFMTMRQSTKRGMNPGMTPDNPMASTQKFMPYLAPVFALSSFYWPVGVVLYWVTTNIWTLGQQFVLFRRYPPLAPVGPAPAVPGKAGKAGPAGGGEKAVGTAKPGGPTKPSGPAKPGGAAQPGRPAPAKPAPAAKKPVTANGQKPSSNGNGGGGVVRRLGRRPPPEPEPAAPEVKLVRQQRARQSRSKRAGKR